MEAPDAAPAPESLVGGGIDIEGAAYRPTSAGQVIRWQLSPRLKRLRGQVCAARTSTRSRRFARYLLHLNHDLRFVRVGYDDHGIALQAVLPCDDPKWLDHAESALMAIYDVLRPQIAWWLQPPELVNPELAVWSGDTK